ncbi:MAG: mandelate racemase/muconate lactonizing enzyme family protein [bacterium]
MKIESLEAGLYRIPLPETLTDATHGEMRDFDLVTVRLRDDDGVEGLGYTYAHRGGGAILSLIEREIWELLEGEDPRLRERHWERMWWGMHYFGRGGPVTFAISAVDIALWDMAARRAGEPLWRYLGGHNPNVPCYAGGIDLLFTLDALLEQTQKNLEKGFRAIKMKVGRPRLSEDLERVAKMRQTLGPDFPLMVDANMRWRVDEAIRASRALAEHDVYWLEEPTIPDDVAGHVEIVRQGALPVAAGENLHSLYEFKNYIHAGAVSFPEPDCSNCGGVTGYLKIAHLAEAHNLPVTTHGIHDIHVHLLAAVPNSSYLEVHGFGLEPYMANPLRIEHGEALAPDRPGHGVELDWKALEAHRGAP